MFIRFSLFFFICSHLWKPHEMLTVSHKFIHIQCRHTYQKNERHRIIKFIINYKRFILFFYRSVFICNPSHIVVTNDIEYNFNQNAFDRWGFFFSTCNFFAAGKLSKVNGKYYYKKSSICSNNHNIC